MENPKKTNVFLMIFYGIIAVLIVVFIIQNWQSVTINILGLKVEGKSFIVFLVIFALGFVSGWFFEYLRHSRKAKKEKKETIRRVRYSEE